MKKHITLALSIVCAVCMTAATARAVNADVTVTLPLDSIAVTNTITIPAGMALDHLVVANNATFSNTVALTVYDADVAGASLYSGSLAASSASAYTYPTREVAYGTLTTQDFYTVKSVRCIVTSWSGSTNTTTGPVRIFLQSRQSD